MKTWLEKFLFFFTSQNGMRCEVDICIDIFINDKGSGLLGKRC